MNNLYFLRSNTTKIIMTKNTITKSPIIVFFKFVLLLILFFVECIKCNILSLFCCSDLIDSN